MTKFGYLCIQEILVNRPSLRPLYHVSGCKMSPLLAWCPRHIQSMFDLIVDIHVMVNLQLSNRGIR